ncbi:MAG: 30S ribosomal protein S12 methylthiotransferase RimO [Polyangiaceae bacterium]|nr:30S ribosomal protein S12 methylthiotransferase RimO [Polyangiaceae bacterium]
MRQRTIHFVSLGCPKNRVDSEVMLGIAVRAGLRQVAEPEEAEILVINTCGFVADAKRESIETILRLATFKTQGACRTLVVAGCLSQRYPDDLAEQLPEVDHFLGSSDLLKLEQILSGESERMLVGSPGRWLMRSSDPRILSTRGASAYVKLAEGCDRSCAFCIIPQIRGRQRSRTPDDLVREVEQLASAGILEINLVAQDTVAYGRDLDCSANLARLVARLAETPGLRWVRMLYLYPEQLDDALLELLGQHPRVLPYVDMPLQHASDSMLRRMRRGHGSSRLRRLVQRLRTRIPGLVLRTAFIVGHPGETEQDFEELCDFVRWGEFERVGVFRYSDETGTVSRDQAGKVPARISAARARRLMAVQRPISRRKNRALTGQKLEVLVEGPSTQTELVFVGRHAGQAPEVDGCVYLSGGPARPGRLQRATVTNARDYDLVAELDPDESEDEHAAPLATKAGRRVTLRTVS